MNTYGFRKQRFPNEKHNKIHWLATTLSIILQNKDESGTHTKIQIYKLIFLNPSVRVKSKKYFIQMLKTAVLEIFRFWSFVRFHLSHRIKPSLETPMPHVWVPWMHLHCISCLPSSEASWDTSKTRVWDGDGRREEEEEGRNAGCPHFNLLCLLMCRQTVPNSIYKRNTDAKRLSVSLYHTEQIGMQMWSLWTV